jgi:hypothetical protein
MLGIRPEDRDIEVPFGWLAREEAAGPHVCPGAARFRVRLCDPLETCEDRPEATVIDALKDKS